MTTFPRSPRVLKGALVGIDLFNPLASVIIFQYNPATMSRSLQAKISGEGNARHEVSRLGGPPTETINLEVEIDATDQLEKDDGTAVGMGIHPQLAALEMLIYPKSSLVILNTALLAAGTMEIVPPEMPFTLLIWGAKRVLPVRVSNFNITEEAHDVNLNPIRARVSLGLQVLTYDDFPVTHPGYATFLAHQLVKETMAVVGSANNLNAVVGGDIKLI